MKNFKTGKNLMPKFRSTNFKNDLKIVFIVSCYNHLYPIVLYISLKLLCNIKFHLFYIILFLSLSNITLFVVLGSEKARQS